ncbi:15-hydroxyprostaglandin dehydrogenase [NAD(+)]-like isoform X2 [Ptychodera flava]|uniref:15-hydroxyprostaglandin dehydrogenase [NAD(+)]-like isoform X2 n=1 Tax=Ptychodera flava TaxID=63121 RepID=UPI00396A0FF4
MNIHDKVAIVTGAASGIGSALAEEFLKEDAKGVSILDVDDDEGKIVCQRLKDKYGDDKVVFIHCDVTSRTEIKDAFEKTKTAFGRVDILCNNAGVMNEVNWEHTIDINVKGVIMGTIVALDYMGVKNGGTGGVIVNTASTLGIQSYPIVPVYGTSKASVVYFQGQSLMSQDFWRTKSRLWQYVHQWWTRCW